eukprot:jgi/Phyca11/107191/e_gw1.13.390.1
MSWLWSCVLFILFTQVFYFGVCVSAPLEDTGMNPVYQRPASCPRSGVVWNITIDRSKRLPRVFHVFKSTPRHVKLPLLGCGVVAMIHNGSHTEYNILGGHVLSDLGRSPKVGVAVVLEA